MRGSVPEEEPPSGAPSPALESGVLAERHDVAFVDLDGVVYRGDEAVPGAVEGLAAARRAGMRAVFVTNNASRTPADVARHLVGLGVPADADDVVTSAQAAAGCLVDLVPRRAPVLVVGGGGLLDAVRERGLRPVSSDDERPEAVVSGFHPDVGWRLLAEGTFAVRRGVPWVACNTDRTLPTPRGMAPGNGTLVDVIRTVTGLEPVVAGKPFGPLHDEAVQRSGARHPLVVGDRLDTDVEGAVRAGVDALLVLTGVSTARDVLEARAPQRPRYVASDLGALTRSQLLPRVVGGAGTCGGWRAEVREGQLHLDGEGDRLDGLRAAAVAVWAHRGPVDLGTAVARLAR